VVYLVLIPISIISIFFTINIIGSASASVPSTDCITFNSSTKKIMITCTSANIVDIYNQINDNNILSRESPKENIWLLNAGLDIQRGATLYINSSDTDWLKIASDGINPNAIHVFGALKIDSVKITSWNPSTNSYGTTNGTRHSEQDKLVTNVGTVRPVIKVEGDATGTTDITNSEIAYLGYEGGTSPGASGLSYYGGDNSIIKNNKIHNLYFGFYSKGVGGMVIEDNIIYDNDIYGLDPHTATHDMIIRNNIVYNNGGFGIICSVDCYNITIENNKVHDNYHGIMLSRNMTNSIVEGNNIYNENVTGIAISDSYYNQIFKNTISNSEVGIFLNVKASSNQIFKNTISNSNNGIVFSSDAVSDNALRDNKIILINPDQTDITFQGDSENQNNTFKQNKKVIKYSIPRFNGEDSRE